MTKHYLLLLLAVMSAAALTIGTGAYAAGALPPSSGLTGAAILAALAAKLLLWTRT